MHLSALLSSLPLPFAEGLRQLVALGFRHVDVIALADRPAAHRAALADSGLVVACAAIGKGLPEDQSLDMAATASRRAAVDQMKRQLTDAAQLGATHAYVVAGCDRSREGLLRFGDSCRQLADFAAQRMLRLCVEPIPGRALASAAAVLDWLDQQAHPNLALLVDIGHCLISREDPAQVVRQAGHRLGYVHLDDNDGVGDLHWPLLRGQLTESILTTFLAALGDIGYTGSLTLELNPQTPAEALREGRKLVERLLTADR